MSGKRAIVVGLLIAAAQLAATAVASESDLITYELDIPAQDLDDSLQAVALASRHRLIYSAELVEGKKTPALKGEYTTMQACQKLLAGTDLSCEVTEDGLVLIRPQAARTTEATRQAGRIRLARNQSGTPEQDSVVGANSSATDSAGRADAASSAAEFNLQEITVTGSRLTRAAFDMPTPVTVISSSQIEQSGFNNIADLLTQQPAMGLGASLATSQFSDDAGAAFVNLRSLGTSRTLVLINGRRRVSGASASAAIDLSTIPAGMIERVELITGGASAVYGADAVSGVVNVILKKDFSGLEFSGQGGFAEHGGAGSSAATLLGGGTFAEQRGSFSFGVSHVRQEPLYSDERSFTRGWMSFGSNPLNTGPEDGIADLVTVPDFKLPLFHPGGAFFLGDGMIYTVDPQFRPIGDADGWDFVKYFQQSMRADTTSVRGNLSYELSDHVEFVAESEFANGSAYSGGAPYYDFGAVLQRDNPYIPAALGARMDADGLTELSVFRASPDQGIRDDDNSRNSFSILTGLQGSFGADWKWQVFGQYGRYELTSRETHQRITSRYLEAIDVIADPGTGNPVCRSAAARAAGCQPLNILGQNAATDQALTYFQVDRTLRVDNTQTLAGAQLTGTPFSLPAGPLASAIGVEYRRDTRRYQDDPLAEAGLLSDKAAGTSLEGEDAVSEAFLELVAPLVRDKPFVHHLSVEGAVRLSEYDSIGRTTAWKLGASWSPVADLRLRATRSRSVRAPNLFELFQPRQISQINMFDPCEISQIDSQPNRRDNCRALGIPEGWEGPAGAGQLAIFDTVGGGNPRLDPETSDAWTAGFVFTPQALPGLSVAIDYWQIEIEAAVQPLDVTTIVEKCVDSATIDNVFCPRVTRGLDSGITMVDYSIINVGKLSTDGVDLQAAYTFGLDALGLDLPGRLSVVLNTSYLRSLEELIDSNDAASLLLRRGEFNTPGWRGTLSLGYTHQALRLSLNTRVIGRARIDMNSSLETYDRPRVGTKVYNDLAAGYEIGKHYDLRLSVNNLLDTEPPANPYTFLGGNSSLYDSIGRYFVLGASAKF